MTDDRPILLFDGVCNLCNRSVQFVIAHDPKARFRFAALQSAAGQRLLHEHGLPPDDMDTIVLIDGARSYTRSAAALRVVRHLSGAWPLLQILVIVPRPLRDWAYGQIVAHRYQRYGKRDTCVVPTRELQGRFLER